MLAEAFLDCMISSARVKAVRAAFVSQILLLLHHIIVSGLLTYCQQLLLRAPFALPSPVLHRTSTATIMPRGIARGARDVVGVAHDREDEIRGDFSASGGSGKNRKRSRGGSSSRGSDRVMEEGTKGGLDTKKTCLKSSARGGKHHDGDDKQESESGTLGDALVRVSRQLHDGLKGTIPCSAVYCCSVVQSSSEEVLVHLQSGRDASRNTVRVPI